MEQNELRQFDYSHIPLNSLIIVIHPSLEGSRSVVRKICKRQKLNIQYVIDKEAIGQPRSSVADKRVLEKTCNYIFGSQAGDSQHDAKDPCHFLPKSLCDPTLLSDAMRAKINQFLLVPNCAVIFERCLDKAPMSAHIKNVLFDLNRPHCRTCRIVTADPKSPSSFPKSVVSGAQFIFVFGQDKSPLSPSKMGDILVGSGLGELMSKSVFASLLTGYATDRMGVVIRATGSNGSEELTDRLFWTTDIERSRGPGTSVKKK